MFESLGYAERRFTRRQALALPVAGAVQLTLGVAFVLHGLLAVDHLQPPPVWLNGYPAIPVTLHAAPERPRTDVAPPERRVKPTGLVEPNMKGPIVLPPPGTATSQEGGPSSPNGLDGVLGLPSDLDIKGFFPSSQPESSNRPSILQTSEVTPPKLVHQVQPLYPPAALAMRLGGRVVLQVVVNEDGHVVDVQVLSSTNALFNISAVTAVSQWLYTAPLAKAGGQAVKCYMSVVVTFQPQ